VTRRRRPRRGFALLGDYVRRVDREQRVRHSLLLARQTRSRAEASLQRSWVLMSQTEALCQRMAELMNARRAILHGPDVFEVATAKVKQAESWSTLSSQEPVAAGPRLVCY
jgi:hypothetical protein